MRRIADTHSCAHPIHWPFSVDDVAMLFRGREKIAAGAKHLTRSRRQVWKLNCHLLAVVLEADENAAYRPLALLVHWQSFAPSLPWQPCPALARWHSIRQKAAFEKYRTPSSRSTNPFSDASIFWQLLLLVNIRKYRQGQFLWQICSLE